jgi:hypothetical protein
MLNRLMRRAAPIGALAATAALALAGPASAGIWTPIASGTTASITAIDYAGTTPVYGTASGQILKGGGVVSTNPGFSVRDIAFNPSGTIGIAALSNARLLVSTNGGGTWTTRALTTFNQSPVCASTPSGPVGTTPVTGNLNAVAWASDTTAYVVGDMEGVVQKTTNSASSFAETSRLANNTCRVDSGSDLMTDVRTVPGSDVVWIADQDFGATSVSTNGITSTVPRRTSEFAVNCFDHHPQLALDPTDASRAFMVDGCSANLQLGATADGGSSWNADQNYFAGSGSDLTGLNGVAIAGGSALAVGNGGAILVDGNGRDAYFQRADGADGTNDWLSVAKLDANTAIVGGTNGRLLTTTSASAIPDVVAPGGTISGPVTATAGQAVAYTANLSDNAGGSGIDPGSLVWSGDGIPNGSGNPFTVAWPSAGYYTLTVSFKDVAGNPGTATLGVVVGTPRPATPLPPVTTATPRATRSTSATADGAKITLGTPNTCVAPGATFRVTLTWKKQKKKGNRFVKVRRADFYIGSKRVKIDKKAPFTQTLKVTASTKRGSTVTVKARAFIRVTHGRSPTKSIKTTIRVCG